MWIWDDLVNPESAGEEAAALGFRPTTLWMLPEAGLSSGFDPGSSSSGWRRWRQAPAEDDSAFARPSWVVGKAAPRLTVSEDPELRILEMEGGQEFPRKPEQGRQRFSASLRRVEELGEPGAWLEDGRSWETGLWRRWEWGLREGGSEGVPSHEKAVSRTGDVVPSAALPLLTQNIPS